jgi:hypothetical protein
MNNSWSQYKSKLKAMYFDDNYKSIDELCKNIPDDVIKDQWINLIYYWKSDKTKVYLCCIYHDLIEFLVMLINQKSTFSYVGNKWTK